MAGQKRRLSVPSSPGMPVRTRVYEADLRNLAIVIRHMETTGQHAGPLSVSAALRWSLWYAAESIRAAMEGATVYVPTSEGSGGTEQQCSGAVR